LQVIAERRFDAASGLRASTVFAMQVDRNGIPWLGADDGLYEYAGGSWRREELPDGFENQQVRSLLLPANGSRWLGTRRGLLYQPRGGAWRVFGEADGLQGQVVFSLVETNAIDGSPRVVAGTTLGVSYFNGEKFIPLPLPAPMQKLGLVLASGFAPDGSAELWVASSMGGAARLNRGAWTYFGPPQGLASPDVQALAVSPGDSGSVLYAAGVAGVFELERRGGALRWVRVPDSPRDAFRVQVVQSPGDQPELWVGLTDGRIFRRRDGTWRPLEKGGSDRHGTITLLTAVPGHGGGTAVYVSSRGGYLARMSIGVAGGLISSELDAANSVIALWVDRGADERDALWVGTNDRGVLQVRPGGTVASIPFAGASLRRSVPFLQRLSLSAPGASATTGGDLLAVSDWVPWVLRGSRFERLDAGLDTARVLQLARVVLPDGRDALVAGTTNGVRLWTGARWERLWPTLSGVVSTLATVPTSAGSVLYLGGRHELRAVTARGSSTESFSPIRAAGVGLSTVRRVCATRVNGQPRLWVLDSDRGVLSRELNQTTWQPLPAHLTRVLSNLGITDFACLDDGRVALSTFTGLSVFDVASPSPDQWRVATQVSDADGLPANGVLAIARSRVASNVLWLGTSFGVGVVDLARATQLPPARLTVRVLSEAQRRLVGQGDALSVGENDLYVDPVLLTFHREELTRFRVRLRGEAEWPSPTAAVRNDPRDGEWLEVPNRYYDDLAPGSYEVTVWAYDWAGREYGPVQRSFSVLTPTWQTWPARIIYVLCGVLLLTVAYRWRVRTIRESTRQLLASERRASDSEGRFRAIFEQALDGHLLLENGKIQAGNAESARLFGVTAPEALEGRTLGELLGADAERPGASVAGEAMVPTARGQVPVQYTIIEVPSADRVLRHAVVRDLTEVRKAEAERAWFQAQVREAQKLESLGTLAGGVAHDFNNLLGVIRGNAELGRTALKRGRSNDDNLGAILDASDRARDIVRQILTFSRRSTPTREYVNLSRLVLDLQPLLRRMIPRTVQLVIEGAEASHLIMGDPTQLQQLLLNLVSNAEYAMRQSTNGLLTIAIASRMVPEGQPAPTGMNVVLQVRDTGAGMTEEVRTRIFEPFFTTKPTGEGTGLGMAVVHGIVTSHEARADVLSALGQGTTFEIRFPQAVIAGLWDEELDPTALLDDEVEDTPDTPGVVERPNESDDTIDVLEDSPYAGTTIVVVDDEPAVARVVERALQHYGHIVHVFNNPELALQFIQQQPSAVDLLITDQMMPGMTGDLLAESAHTLRADLPVLILTGFSHRLIPERIAAARAHAVMLKPVELDELKRRVDEALAKTLRR
jgi:signal transduction histidine kinase/CheY-like chemotaxis protein/ligand-binding sensor domain-containing protein